MITSANNQSTTIDLMKISQDFLYAVRTNEDADIYSKALENVGEEELLLQISTDARKNAFWLNIYNGYVQLLLKQNPERYKNRHKFFTGKQIMIAGKKLSLDDIEHGILRRSKIKWSLGYLNKVFPGRFEKKNRVEKRDARIHFALNCGAKSCPPIAYYSPEKIDQQLELATRNYLKTEVDYNKENKRADVPAIMGWFRADFGGKKGIKRLLKKYNGIEAETIKFKKYDWDLYLNNYKPLTDE